MTSAERRERERLRSERRRRAAGIQPRKPAERPWLSMGISRSTFYRRRNANHAKTAAKVMPLASNRPETPFFASQAIARVVAFYVQPPRQDRCDALVAELAAILARGQAALEGRAGILRS